MYQKIGRKNKSRDKLLIAEYNKGVTLAAIGKMFGVSRQRVQQLTKEAGISRIRVLRRVEKEVLEDLYINKRLPVVKICNLLKVSLQILSKSVALYGMPTPKQRERILENVKIPKDILEDLFIHKRIAVVAIAKLLKVSQKALRHNLDEYGMTRPNIYTQTERNYTELNRDELYHFYVEKNYTLTKVAEHFNCGSSNVKQELIRFKILKSPKISETKLKQNRERKAKLSALSDHRK